LKARYVFGMEADAAAGRRGLHERVGVDELIGTIKDARVVEARELTSSKGRLRLGKCLLEGTEAVGWALDSGITIERAFVQAARLGDAFVRWHPQEDYGYRLLGPRRWGRASRV
jgi:hypothetical protein